MDAVVKMEFYDFNASDEDQEAALVFYNNQYVPNTGVDLAAKDGEAFAVVASISGTVTRVEEDATLGNVIEIEHANGIVTQYSSVKDVKVEVGDKVKQGQELAMAGQSLFNEEAGTHVHFEIRKDGVAVNPTSYFNKSISVLQEETPADETNGSKVKDKQMIDDPDLSGEDEKKKLHQMMNLLNQRIQQTHNSNKRGKGIPSSFFCFIAKRRLRFRFCYLHNLPYFYRNFPISHVYTFY